MNHHDDRVIRQRLPRDDLTHENYNVKQSATIATITMFVATFARLFAQCSLICTTMVLVYHQNDHWQAVCPASELSSSIVISHHQNDHCQAVCPASELSSSIVITHHQNDHWQAVCPVGQGLPPVLRRHSRLQILLLVNPFQLSLNSLFFLIEVIK